MRYLELGSEREGCVLGRLIDEEVFWRIGRNHSGARIDHYDCSLRGLWEEFGKGSNNEKNNRLLTMSPGLEQ